MERIMVEMCFWIGAIIMTLSSIGVTIAIVWYSTDKIVRWTGYYAKVVDAIWNREKYFYEKKKEQD